MIFYTLLLGFLYQGEPSCLDGLIWLILMCSGLFTYEFLARNYCLGIMGFLNNLKYFCYIYFGFSSIYLIRESSQGLLMVLLCFWPSGQLMYLLIMAANASVSVNWVAISPNKTIEGTLKWGNCGHDFCCCRLLHIRPYHLFWFWWCRYWFDGAVG